MRATPLWSKAPISKLPSRFVPYAILVQKNLDGSGMESENVPIATPAVLRRVGLDPERRLQRLEYVHRPSVWTADTVQAAFFVPGRRTMVTSVHRLYSSYDGSV